MPYDRVIEKALREAQDLLLANLPPTRRLPDDRAVAALHAAISAPAVQEALERGNDTAQCFVLRAVNRILSEKPLAHRETINRLWDVLDDAELDRTTGSKRNSRRMMWRKKPPAR